MDHRQLFLGCIVDAATSKPGQQPLLYDPADLTTHGIVTGMTGSGKTGLGVALLEEAALQGIPAIVIDPKGDLTNLLLHFPDLAAPDLSWDTGRETLREKISTIVTALLSLIGIGEVDPLRSREHILLSNIVEHHWSSGGALTLADLIIETQKAPV